MGKRILFVCLGNICRSPLAEGIMLHMIDKTMALYEVDSAGTAGYHIGEQPDHRTIKNAAKHGVDLKNLRARQFVKEDFERFDLILVMDRKNYADVIRQTKLPDQMHKVHLFLPYCGLKHTEEMPDPYYGDENAFEHVFQLCWEACENLIEVEAKKVK